MTKAITHMEVAEITKEVTKGFDYQSIAPDVATEAKAVAARIKERAKAAIIDTGQDLIAMKERLGHGHFGSWLAAEFDMTQRTAQNYMNAADVFGAKSEIVSHLPAVQLYKLSSPDTPVSVREKVVQSLEAGRRVEAHEIRYLIKTAIEANSADAREKKRTEKFSPKRREKSEKSWEQIKAEDAAQHEEHVRRSAQAQIHAAEAYAMLALHLGDKVPEFVDLLRKCDQHTFYRVAAGKQLIPIELPVSMINENGKVALPAPDPVTVNAEMQALQEGRREPISVIAVDSWDETGRPVREWQVLEGRERFHAAERLKLETILCVVVGS